MEEHEQSLLERDEFKRDPMAENLADLLTSDVDASPLLMEGGWGVGKTLFTHRVIKKIKERPGSSDFVQCLYIDAFKSDYIEDPLLMLISSIANLLKGENDESEKINRWKSAARPLAKTFLKVGSKAIVSHILKQNLDEIGTEISSALQKGIDESFDIAIDTLIEENRKLEENTKILKEALKSIVEEKQLIIFIDELDRCRPDFALALLERIKHVFDVHRVKFFLVANRDQLIASIDHSYGAGDGAQMYLDKFLKFSFTLSPIYTEADGALYKYAACEYCKILLYEKRDRLGVFNGDYPFMLIIKMIQVNKKSMREVERLIRYFEVYKYLVKDNNDLIDGKYRINIFLFLLAIYCVCFEREIYHKALRGDIDGEGIMKIYDCVFVPTNPPPREYRVMPVIGYEECFSSENKLIRAISEYDLKENKKISFDENDWAGFYTSMEAGRNVSYFKEIFINYIRKVSFMDV